MADDTRQPLLTDDLCRLLLPYPPPACTALVAARLGLKASRVNASVTRFRQRGGPAFFYFMLHKRCGSVTHKPGDDGRDNELHVYDELPRGYPPVPHVGRLDKETEGLLLFSEDGALAHALHTRGSVPKTYLVLVSGLGARPCQGSLAKPASAGASPAEALAEFDASMPCTGSPIAELDSEGVDADVSWHDVQMRLLRAPMVIVGCETLPADVGVCSVEEIAHLENGRRDDGMSESSQMR